MELVHFDADLLLNERQVACTRKSISQMKKKLHDTQLTLILQPTENDLAEMDIWNAKVNELINRREKLDFPSMQNILSENEEGSTAPWPILKPACESSSPLLDGQFCDRQSSVMQEKIWEKMKRIELRKRLGTDQAFGANTEGEILRTIDNYQGCHSRNPISRILVRKHHRPGPFDNVSSVPASIGPGQYEKSGPHLCKSGGNIGYQMAFKACPRDKIITATGLRFTALRRNLASRHNDSDKNYFLRGTDKKFHQNVMQGFANPEYVSSCLSESAAHFVVDRELYDQQALHQSANFENCSHPDLIGSFGLKVSKKLNFVTGRPTGVIIPEHSELPRDYTLGALSSLRHNSQSNSQSKDVNESCRRHSNNMCGNDRLQGRRNSTEQGNRLFHNGADAGKDQSKCKDGEGRSGSVPFLIPFVHQQKVALPIQAKTLHLESVELTRQPSSPEDSSFDYSRNNEKEILIPRSNIKPKSSISRGPLFSRKNTKIVKRIYFPLKRPSFLDMSRTDTYKFYPKRTPSVSVAVDRSSTSDDFEILSGDTETASHIEFPPFDIDLRPVIDKWYIDNNLYSPIKPKTIMKIKNKEYFPLNMKSSQVLTTAEKKYEEQQKNIIALSKSDFYIRNSKNFMESSKTSSNDLDNILLPNDASVGSAIISQLFSSSDEFHLFLHQDEMM